MNNRRSAYYPVLFYTGLLLLVWLVSLFAGIFGLFTDYTAGDNSLFTTPGVRWALRNAVPSIDNAPWGNIVMFVVIVGLLRGSGILRMLSHLLTPRKLTKNEKRSFIFALAALSVYLIVVYIATLSSWEVFAGVTGEISSSPVVQGWVMLVFAGILFVSMIYGFIYGNYRSIIDVASSVGDTFVIAVPALIAVVPASGLISCLQYTGLVGIHDGGFIYYAIYVIPFVYVAVLDVYVNRQQK